MIGEGLFVSSNERILIALMPPGATLAFSLVLSLSSLALVFYWIARVWRLFQASEAQMNATLDRDAARVRKLWATLRAILFPPALFCL